MCSGGVSNDRPQKRARSAAQLRHRELAVRDASKRNPHLFNSGFADFTLANGTVLPFRLTLALVKVDGKWLVVQHHGSPVPT